MMSGNGRHSAAIRGNERYSAPITAPIRGNQNAHGDHPRQSECTRRSSATIRAHHRPTHLEEIGMKQRRARRRDRAWEQTIDLRREAIRRHQRSTYVIRGYQRLSEVIRDYQTSSEVNIRHQRLSEVIRGYQRSSEAIRGNQTSSEVNISQHTSSEVIRGLQTSSEVIRGHQRSSEVIRGHQWSSVVIRGREQSIDLDLHTTSLGHP